MHKRSMRTVVNLLHNQLIDILPWSDLAVNFCLGLVLDMCSNMIQLPFATAAFNSHWTKVSLSKQQYLNLNNVIWKM